MIFDYKNKGESSGLRELRSAFRLPILETEKALAAAESMGTRERAKDEWRKAGVKNIYPWMLPQEKETPDDGTITQGKEPTFLDKLSDVKSLRLLEKFANDPMMGMALGEIALGAPGILSAGKRWIEMEKAAARVKLGDDLVARYPQGLQLEDLFDEQAFMNAGLKTHKMQEEAAFDSFLADDIADWKENAIKQMPGFTPSPELAKKLELMDRGILDSYETSKVGEMVSKEVMAHEANFFANKAKNVFENMKAPGSPSMGDLGKTLAKQATMLSEQDILQQNLADLLSSSGFGKLSHVGIGAARNPKTQLSPFVEELLSPVTRTGLGAHDVSGLRGELIDMMTKKYGPSPARWSDEQLSIMAEALAERKYGREGVRAVKDWLGGNITGRTGDVDAMLPLDQLKSPAVLSRYDMRIGQDRITPDMFASRPYSFSLGKKTLGALPDQTAKIFMPDGTPIVDVNAAFPMNIFALTEREIITKPQELHLLKTGQTGIKYMSTSSPSLSKAEEEFVKMYDAINPRPAEDLLQIREGLNPNRHPEGGQLLYSGSDLPMIDKDFATAGEHFPLAVTNKNAKDAYQDLINFTNANPEALLRVYVSPGGISAFDVGKYAKELSPRSYYETWGDIFRADPMYKGLVVPQQNYPVRLGQKLRTLEEGDADFIRLPIDLLGRGTADAEKVGRLKWLDQQFFSGPLSRGTSKWKRFFPKDLWNEQQRNFVLDQIALLGPEKAATILKYGLPSSLLGTAGMTLMPQQNQ